MPRCLSSRMLALPLFAAILWAVPLFAEDKADSTSSPNSDAAFASHVKPFLTAYCVGCHGEAKQKGERRFDRLSDKIADDNALVDFQDMLDQLNLGEMPPKDARQPAAAERRHVIAWLTATIDRFHAARKQAGGQTVLRRLNSREYRNTIRDLLHVNMTMFDPTVGFPSDRTVDHLDNVGDSLVTSGQLLQRYLAAADRVIEKVMTPSEKPTVKTWTFHDNFRQQPEIDKVHQQVNGLTHLTLYDVIGADKPEGAYGPLLAFKEGVPFDGMYEVRFQAEAVNRRHPYDLDFVGTDPEEPLRLGIVPGSLAAGPLHKPQPIEPLLAEMDLADEPKWYTVRVWLDAGFAPRFTFRNGLMDARNMWGKMMRKYPEQFPKPIRGGIVEHRFNAIKYGKLPQIHIHEVQITGPLYESWPTASQRAVLGDDWETSQPSGMLSEAQMRRNLMRLATQAYRRPVSSDEVERLMQVISARRQAGRTPLEAYADGLKAMLCSPAFLYLEEPEAGRLSNHAIASRLSYFLWSSLPDQELLDLAASGQIGQPAILSAQVDRLLRDPRSAAFIDGFLDSWLTLRDLGSMPPDREKFGQFYRFDLQRVMRQETQLFLRHVVDENLSIVNFLESDFAYVNKPLARLYGLTPPSGSQFQRVSLSDRRRGGLLGQASVLTVTANGIDTSPVVRGVWLLENILGTPPSPPPPDVEPLDPDIRGVTSIREQLQKHRSVASCYDCHRKIDPLGFALENFDAIGQWRETYKGAGKIDSTGELPSGETFGDLESFKQILVQRKRQFAAALTTKLLAYSTGRSPAPSDRPHVERIVKELENREDRMRDLIELVVQSEAFRSK